MGMFTDVGGVPVVASSSGHDGGFGGQWIWAIVLVVFIALFAGGGGLFGGRREGCGDGVSNASGAAFTELNGRLDSIQSQIGHNNDLAELRALYTQACATDMNVTQQAFNVSNLVNQTRTDTLLNFKDAALQQANCCCETQRSIDGVRFQNAQDTAAVIAANNANTQRILDRLCETERDRLRDEVANLRLANSQARQDFFIERQSDRVIGALTPPCPVPAYPAWPSSQPINPVAYGGYPGYPYAPAPLHGGCHDGRCA